MIDNDGNTVTANSPATSPVKTSPVRALILILAFAWVGFVFALMVNPLTQPLIWVEQGKTTVTDYAQDYQMGVIARSEERFQAYDEKVQNRVLDRIAYPMPSQQEGQHFILQTMPFYFAFMIPWSLLPLRESYCLFFASMLVAGIYSLYTLARKQGEFSVSSTIMLLILVFTSAPAVYALRVGQAVIFLLALMCGFMYFWCKKKSYLAGLCLGLATFRPQYSVIFLAPVLMRKQWRMFAAFFATEVVLLLVSIFAVGWDNVINYPAILFHHDSRENYQGVNPHLMISLRGVLTGLSQSAVLAISIAVFAVVFLIVLKASSLRAKSQAAEPWLLSVTLMTALVFAPHSHFYDVILLSIPAALTLSKKSRDEVGNSIPYRIWSYCLYAAPILGWLRIYLGLEFPPAYLFLPLHLLMLITGCIICFKHLGTPAGQNGTLEEKVVL
jgi:hypothetical protein